MPNFFPTEKMLLLYSILQQVVPGLPENFDGIRTVFLYKDKQAETGTEEERFNPCEQASFNSAKGFWCWTPLCYDEKGKPVRKVSAGPGSWNLRDTRLGKSSNGVEWCVRKLKYNIGGYGTLKFTMKQYSLGAGDAKPSFALCQIFGQTFYRENLQNGPSSATLATPARVLPGRLADSGGMGTQPYGGRAMEQLSVPDKSQMNHILNQALQQDNTNIQQQIPYPSAQNRVASQGHSQRAAGRPSSQDKNQYEKRKLEFSDSFDGTSFDIEDDDWIRVLKKYQSASDCSQSYVARQNARIEENNQFDMQCHVPPYGTAGPSYDYDMHQDSIPSNQFYMPNLEALPDNNQYCQQSDIPRTVFCSGISSVSNANQWNLLAGNPLYTSGESWIEPVDANQWNLLAGNPLYTSGESWIEPVESSTEQHLWSNADNFHTPQPPS